jgi:parallel beta-helix repeat protein
VSGGKRSWLAWGIGVAVAALFVVPAGAAPSQSRGGCSKTVASGESVTALVATLAPGETGCLSGTFHEDVTIRRGGAPGAPITLTAAPGQEATIVGRFWVADSANDVVVSSLNLDGRNEERHPSPTINGDRVSFIGNDVTNAHTPAICFIVGHSGRWGVAVDTLIQGNRIHNCGELPATNHDHGIYVESSRRLRVLDNLIYDNADRGVQFYPDAQNSLVQGNIIDGNGQGILFSGNAGLASNGNLVVGNVISNSELRFNVESWYPEGNPIGQDNLARANCIWNGRRGNVADEWGFRAEENVVADPQFANRAAKDFRLDPSGACARLVPTAARVETAVRQNAGPVAKPAQAKPSAEKRAVKPVKKKQRSRPRDRVRRVVERLDAGN